MTDGSPMFALSEEHLAIREAVRAVCDAKVAPSAAEVDEKGEFPQAAYDALVASDFAAPHIAEEYGGAGADALATCIVIEEVARACMSSSLIPSVNKLGTMPLILGGSEEIKKKYLSQVAAGRGDVLLLPLRARRGLRRGGDEDPCHAQTATTGSSTASSAGSPTRESPTSTRCSR